MNEKIYKKDKLDSTKGQKISEADYNVLISSKKRTKIFF